LESHRARDVEGGERGELALGVESAQVIDQARLTVLSADSVKAALDIDWNDEDEQRSALKRAAR